MWGLLSVSVAVWLILLWYWRKLFSGAAGLMAGGVLSNLVERVWRGAVTDVFLLPGGWALNLADFALVVGALLVILRREKR